ncbi:MAG: TolB-like 6-bladed beta-propeller domain-containing protein [Prevotellaceae bacterium]|jgi:hypothetical protein|nr:TolB-like 6-bladed beta-propeller domain-containing protein [Prevotellaceae bacterium]
MKKKFTCILAGVWLLSCTSPEKKTADCRLNHSAVYDNELLIGQCVSLVASSNHIIGVDAQNLDKLFFVQNIADTSSFFHFGDKGQGPGEFIYPFSIQLVDDSSLFVYDLMLKKINRINIDFESGRTDITGQLLDEKLCFSVVSTAYGQYLGIGAFIDEMFILLDSTGVRTSMFFEYPYKDESEKNISNSVRAMAYQGKIKTNTSRTKLVYSAAFADILYFYNIERKDLRIIKKIENRFCKYKPEENSGTISAPIMSDNEHGCIDLYATDQYVYMLYSGRSFKKYQEKIGESNRLRIYDWQGNLLLEVEIDLPCKNLCVSANDTFLWAIAEMPEPKIVAYDLRGLIDGLKQ